jgi:hypothetical protein
MRICGDQRAAAQAAGLTGQGVRIGVVDGRAAQRGGLGRAGAGQLQLR